MKHFPTWIPLLSCLFFSGCLDFSGGTTCIPIPDMGMEGVPTANPILLTIPMDASFDATSLYPAFYSEGRELGFSMIRLELTPDPHGPIQNLGFLRSLQLNLVHPRTGDSRSTMTYRNSSASPIAQIPTAIALRPSNGTVDASGHGPNLGEFIDPVTKQIHFQMMATGYFPSTSWTAKIKVCVGPPWVIRLF